MKSGFVKWNNYEQVQAQQAISSTIPGISIVTT
jgi:hypothetical protein